METTIFYKGLYWDKYFWLLVSGFRVQGVGLRAYRVEGNERVPCHGSTKCWQEIQHRTSRRSSPALSEFHRIGPKMHGGALNLWSSLP